MEIPASFKSKIKDTFYDKEITPYKKTSTVDTDGFAHDTMSTKGTSFYGNVRYGNLAELQDQEGIKIEADLLITTDAVVELGDILKYGNDYYRVKRFLKYDSHNLIACDKWQ